MAVTLEEARHDLECSTRDIAALEKIIQGIMEFQNSDPREGRNYRTDLFKWDAYLQEARQLDGLIRRAISKAEGKE